MMQLVSGQGGGDRNVQHLWCQVYEQAQTSKPMFMPISTFHSVHKLPVDKIHWLKSCWMDSAYIMGMMQLSTVHCH